MTNERPITIETVCEKYNKKLAEIERLRRALDNIKVRAYERGDKVLHDMALEALATEQDEPPTCTICGRGNPDKSGMCMACGTTEQGESDES